MEQLPFKIGMDAVDVIVTLVKAIFFNYLDFEIYTPLKNLEEEPKIIRLSIKRMLFNNSGKTVRVESQNITIKKIKELISCLSKKEVLAVSSKVKILNMAEEFHIPMMDFKCEISKQNLEKIKEFLKFIHQRGALLSSGRSYHFYGTRLLTQKEWLDFMANCLLFEGFVDYRFIGHQLKLRHNTLRISTNELRPTMPKVIALVE